MIRRVSISAQQQTDIMSHVVDRHPDGEHRPRLSPAIDHENERRVIHEIRGRRPGHCLLLGDDRYDFWTADSCSGLPVSPRKVRSNTWV
jgi:hypothetical protein